MSHEVPKGIQSISQADIHRITSGQVVLDIQSAVKELIENALDAGAKAIEVRFKEYGADLIEVIDNGCGIGPENYESLALKHHTSKLSNFQDLTSVRTFGFRGEALSSLCELCKVQVITATKEEEPVGTVLELNRDGTIKSQDKKVARQRGTTVSLDELFATLPVRRMELLKNVKREFAKAQGLLQAYAIISKGVRWVVSNTVKGRRNSVMTITGSDSSTFLQNNVSAVFGAKACTPLIPLDLEIPIEETRIVSKKGRSISDEDEDMNESSGTIRVQGLISRPTHGSGRASSDRVFLYLNGRPWDSSRIMRAFNEIYKSFNHNQLPMVIANFTIEGERYDVNVSPDKRTLFLHDEAEIIEGLKTALEKHLSPFQSTFTVNGANMSAAKDAAIQSQLPYKRNQAEFHSNSSQIGTQLREDLERRSSSQSDEEEESDEDNNDEAEKLIRSLKKQRRYEPLISRREASRLSTPNDEEISNTVSSRESTMDADLADPLIEKNRKEHVAKTNTQLSSQSQGRRASPATIEAKLTGPNSPVKIWDAKVTACTAASTQIDQQEDDPTNEDDIDELEYLEEGLSADQQHEALHRRQEYKDGLRLEINLAHEKAAMEDEEREANLPLLEKEGQQLPVEGSTLDTWKNEMLNYVHKIDGSIVVQIDMTKLRSRLQEKVDSIDHQTHSTRNGHLFDHAGVTESDAEAIESTLSRSIDKSDFAMMEIIGQFNLGFILARRRSDSGEDDLFIIDQHASDEKYNFELLQRNTMLKSQTLIRPRILELPSSVEMVAAQHIETLANHGFIVSVNEVAMPGSRVELRALPISKNTTFGVTDLEELLHRLEDVTPNSARAKAIRCSKLYNMLASRSCRKSVMVGRALTSRQMKVIIQHMGEIEQPWNCPHGRPTMRHLHQLNLYPDEATLKSKGAIDWQSLL